MRGLPPTGGATEAKLPFSTGTWPDWDTSTMHLFSDVTSHFDAAAPVLKVGLEKAWDIDVLVSCRFDRAHLDGDELGLWPWIVAWRAAHGGPFSIPDLEGIVLSGQHWMFTPSRLVRLVHAVRTPLAAPDGTQLGVQRPGVGSRSPMRRD